MKKVAWPEISHLGAQGDLRWARSGFREDEGLSGLRKAQQLDPERPFIRKNLGTVLSDIGVQRRQAGNRAGGGCPLLRKPACGLGIEMMVPGMLGALLLLVLLGIQPAEAGLFNWPLDNPATSQVFSCHGCIRSKQPKFHTGADITASGLQFNASTWDFNNDSNYQVPVRSISAGTIEKIVRIDPNTCGTRPIPSNNSPGTACFDHGLGNTVIVKIQDGLYALYGHMDSISSALSEISHTPVSVGTPLGVMGHSEQGLQRSKLFGPHVHLELKSSPTLENPASQFPNEEFWGYSKQKPNLLGYQDPAPYITSDVTLAEGVVETTADTALFSAPELTSDKMIWKVNKGQRFASFASISGWYAVHVPSKYGPSVGWVQATAIGSAPTISVANAPGTGVPVFPVQSASSGSKATIWNGQKFVPRQNGKDCTDRWFQIDVPAGWSGNFPTLRGWISSNFVSLNSPNALGPDRPGCLSQELAASGPTVENSNISEGASIRLSAPVSHPGSQTVKLEVELKKSDTPFTGVPTPGLSSALVANGTTASTPWINNLTPGTYEWQGRTVDSSGNTSDWISFGTTKKDFTVLPGTPLPTTPTTTTVSLIALPGQLNVKGHVATDSAGNYYVVGSLETDNVLPDTGLDIWIGKFGPAGNLIWSTLWDSACSDNFACQQDFGSGIAVGPSGSIYVVGTVGGFTRVLKLLKYTSAGSLVWAKTLNPGSDGDLGSDLNNVEPKVHVDSNENLYIAGTTNNQSGCCANVKRRFDAFVGKYDSNGVAIWGRSFDGSGQDYDSARAVTVDANGNVLVAGFVSNAANSFNLLGETTNDYQPLDFWVAKYNSAGTQQWIKTYNGAANKRDVANAIAVDLAGNVFVAGSSFVSGEADSMFVRKHDPAGATVWTSTATFNFDQLGNLKEFANAISLDSSGNSYLSIAVPGGFQWLVKLSAQGKVLWKTEANVPQLLGMVLQPDGTMLVAGGGTGGGTTSSPYYPAGGYTPQVVDDAHTLGTQMSPASVIAAESIPAAPTSVAAVSLSSSSIQWRWVDASSFEVGYRVTSDSGGVVSPELPQNTVTWTEAGLLPGRAYVRDVEAFNSEGAGHVQLTGCTQPDTPSDLMVYGNSFHRIVGVVADPSNPVDSIYRLTLSSSPSFADSLVIESSGPEILASGLMPATTYYGRVSVLACDGSLVSLSSAPFGVTYPLPANVVLSTVGPSGGTFPTPDPGTTLRLTGGIPAGASLLISIDPTNAPVEVAPEDILTANSGLPRSVQLTQNSIREFSLLSNGQAHAGVLTGSITLPYPDADNDGFVDGTSPRIKAENLRLYTLVGQTWVEASSAMTVDSVAKTATAPITHLSVYALAGNATAIALSGVRVYPIPWKPGAGGRFDTADAGVCGRGLIFDQLTAEATIRIYNMVGDLVRDLGVSPSDGGCKAWDGKNDAGADVASGIYVAVIKGEGGKAVKKLAIER